MGDFNGKGHPRDAAHGLGLYANDVGALACEDFRDVAQQALPVGGFHGDIDRVEGCFVGRDSLAPCHIDDALGIARGQFAEVAAIAAVDTDTFAAGDEAANGIGRGRFAAFGQLRQQRIDPDDEHAALRRAGGGARASRRLGAGEAGVMLVYTHYHSSKANC